MQGNTDAGITLIFGFYGKDAYWLVHVQENTYAGITLIFGFYSNDT